MNPLSDMGGVMLGHRTRVLLMDPLSKEREMMARFLAAWNFEAVPAANAAQARMFGAGHNISIALLADAGGEPETMALIRSLREATPEMETILITENDSASFATEAFRAGVYDCLKRPVEFSQLSMDLNTLRDAVQRRIERKVWDRLPDGSSSLKGMVGFSAPMQAVFASLRRFAQEDSPVLITGLTGSGKEIAASTLHSLSARAGELLAIYRCCGVSEELAETELFGGQRRGEMLLGTAGIIESARGGTLFLDEIGDLPYATQLRLHNALSEMICKAVGPPSVRIVAATRSNLASLVALGHFAAPLYGLVSANVIHLPSLTERLEDIPLLCRRFLEESNAEFDKQIRGFSPAAERVLLSYAWPGNVRELENVIGRACLLADQKWIELSDLSVSRALDQRFGLSWTAEWLAAAVATDSANFQCRPSRKRATKG